MISGKLLAGFSPYLDCSAVGIQRWTG